MKPPPFRHYAPSTVDEAVALLARLAPDDGRVLAGGQSLVPTMAFRLARPAHLVDINGIAALGRLAVADGKLDFRKPADADGAPSGGDYDSSNPLQLVLGARLLRFRPRVSGAGQATGFEARGWSVFDKDAIVGTAPAGTTSVRSLPDDPASLAGRFGDAKFVSVDAAPADQQHVEACDGNDTDRQ